jgi:hypothetical protein
LTTTIKSHLSVILGYILKDENWKEIKHLIKIKLRIIEITEHAIWKDLEIIYQKDEETLNTQNKYGRVNLSVGVDRTEAQTLELMVKFSSADASTTTCHST